MFKGQNLKIANYKWPMVTLKHRYKGPSQLKAYIKIATESVTLKLISVCFRVSL